MEAHCVIPDGFRAGQMLRLYDYQLLWFGMFYLVRGDVEFDARNPILAPAFVYRRGILIGPQKVGKNPMIACQVCAEGVGPVLFAGWAGKDDGYACSDAGCGCGWEYAYDPGEPMGMAWPTPLIQITAFSDDSTENTYDALRPMIERGSLADLIPKTGEEFIRLPGGGRIDTVTSSNRSRLGQRVTFVPQDELGLWTKRNKMTPLADTQYRNLAGMGGRAALTSNAWDPAEKSVAQRECESKARDIYRQFTRPPKELRDLKHFERKGERRKIFRAVYPKDTLREHNGHVDLDAIEAEAADMTTRDAPQAARFFGNLIVAGHGKAVDPKVWGKLARVRTIEPGVRIGLGFDGSISEDSTILRGCTADGHSFILGKWERPEGEAGIGWRVPRLKVGQAVRDAFATYKVGRMLCDPPKWYSEVEAWAAEFGDEVVLAFETNQDRRMGPAVDRWLTGIEEGIHTHDDDPTTTGHVLNAHKRKCKEKADPNDPRTLYTLTKGDDGGKIDAAVADVLAYDAAMSMPAEPEPEEHVPFAFLDE